VVKRENRFPSASLFFLKAAFVFPSYSGRQSGQVFTPLSKIPIRVNILDKLYMKRLLIILALGALALAIDPSARAQEVIFDYSSNPLQYSVGTSPQTELLVLGSLQLPGSSFLDIEIAPAFNGANYLSFAGGGTSFGFATQIYTPLNCYFTESLEPLQTWSDLGSHSTMSWADISSLNQSGGTGAELRSNPTYIPFYFQDSTDNNTVKYGYLTMESYVTGSGASAVLNLDILNYAYENSGAQIQVGPVPEPSTLALAGLGGLGLLFFRRRK
jgi:hypothetical protein